MSQTSLADPIEQLLNHRFKNEDLLWEALTHSSYSNESNEGTASTTTDNERLEYLGDAVLGLVVAEKLMELFPKAHEGDLSKWRSYLVSRQSLAETGAEIGLGQFLRLGKGERRSGGSQKRSILSAGVEAIVGALYLDAGLDKVTPFAERIFAKKLAALVEAGGVIQASNDSKTCLQEKTQGAFRVTPSYRLAGTWGLDHDKTFKVELVLRGNVVAIGEGKSKKEAEQDAARTALESLEF